MNLLSFGDLQRATNLQPHRLRYILESRQIRPADRVAGANLFARSSLEEIMAAARAIQERRSTARPGVQA